MTLTSDRARIRLMPRVKHVHTDFVPVKVSGRDAVRWQCGSCPFMASWECVMSPEEADFITKTLGKAAASIATAMKSLHEGLQKLPNGLKTSGWISGSGGTDSDPQGPDADVYVDPWDAKYKGVVGIDPGAEDFVQDIARIFDVPMDPLGLDTLTTVKQASVLVGLEGAKAPDGTGSVVVPSRVLARDEPCADPARCDVHTHDRLQNDAVALHADFHTDFVADAGAPPPVDEYPYGLDVKPVGYNYDGPDSDVQVYAHIVGLGDNDLSFNQLRDLAKWLNVKGRGNMRKDQLADAIKLHLTD